jgi:Fe(II)/alpha-ketoglutarate-dependent arginine beta-hydroxylase
VNHLVLEPDELAREVQLVRSVMATYDSVEDPRFLAEANVIAHDLPARARRFLTDFRLDEPGFCVIGGHPVDDRAIGTTPRHWRDPGSRSSTLSYEILIVLYTSLLGDVFGWATQQDGRLVHDVFPIRGHEQEQLGSGSETLLTWHTEDAFHPCRGDYLVLACLRNPDGVATNLGCVDDLVLDPDDVQVLFRESFTIRPDESHKAENNSAGVSADFEAIMRMTQEPDRLAVLFGDPGRPYIRADPYFMDEPDDPMAAAALRRFVAEMDRHINGVVLQPGEFLFLDNYKVVHGREPFRARFDGTDRWLKRVNATRDLRKSRAYREHATVRVIG